MWDGKWALSLLERDVAAGMWTGETTQLVWWLYFVWDRKWTVSILERDVSTREWRWRDNNIDVRIKKH